MPTGKPPILQVRAWSILKGWPQVQWEGGFDQPYRRERASLNADSYEANPWSSIGSEESQVDVPFSGDSSIEHCRIDGMDLEVLCFYILLHVFAMGKSINRTAHHSSSVSIIHLCLLFLMKFPHNVCVPKERWLSQHVHESSTQLSDYSLLFVHECVLRATHFSEQKTYRKSCCR